MDLDKYADFAHEKSTALFFAVLALWLLVITWNFVVPRDNFYVFAYAQILLPTMALGILLLGFVPREAINVIAVAVGAFALFVLLTLALWCAQEYSLVEYSIDGDGQWTAWVLFPGIAGFLSASLCGGFIAGLYLKRRKLNQLESVSYSGFLLAKAFGMFLILSLFAGIIMLGFMNDCCNEFLSMFRTASYLSNFPLEVMFTSFLGASFGVVLAQSVIGGKKR